jgi:clan AA aspartic protease (TIGR02281 family)
MVRHLCCLALIAGLVPTVGHAATTPNLDQKPVAVSVAMERRDSGTFYISGAIQGYGDVALLVDTGSSFLVINEAMLVDLEKAGSASYSHELHGSMADGSDKAVAVYRLAGLRLGAECWIRDVEAVVFPGTSRPILGMNILTRLAPFTFSTDPPQLDLNQCTGLPPAEFAELAAPAPAATPAPSGRVASAPRSGSGVPTDETR